MPRKIKAVFTDLDGTLYNPEHSVSRHTLKTVEMLQQTGIPFIVATGRAFPDVFANLATTGLKPDFIITSNGSRVHDKHHELVYGCDVNPESVCRIFQLSPHLTEDGHVDPSLPARRITYNVNCNARWLTNERRPEILALFHPTLNCEEVDPMKVTPEMLTGTHSMFAWAEPEDLWPVKHFVERELPDVSSAFSMRHIVDFYPRGNHKGVAVEKVCEKLGITLQDVVAFGDGMNDVQMLKGVGQGFVMANAPQMVKEATVGLPVIGSNREEAVAAKIEGWLADDAFEKIPGWPT